MELQKLLKYENIWLSEKRITNLIKLTLQRSVRDRLLLS